MFLLCHATTRPLTSEVPPRSLGSRHMPWVPHDPHLHLVLGRLNSRKRRALATQLTTAPTQAGKKCKLPHNEAPSAALKAVGVVTRQETRLAQPLLFEHALTQCCRAVRSFGLIGFCPWVLCVAYVGSRHSASGRVNPLRVLYCVCWCHNSSGCRSKVLWQSAWQMAGILAVIRILRVSLWQWLKGGTLTKRRMM